MKTYTITTRETGTAIYHVEAESEDDARKKFYEGDAEFDYFQDNEVEEILNVETEDADTSND